MRSLSSRLLALVPAALALAAGAHAQSWSDDFESYAVGSALETQGGWTGWDNVITTNTVVSAAHARSGTRSIQPNPGSDTVHEYGGPTTGTWVYTGHVYIEQGFSSQLDYMIMNEYAAGGPYEWGSWIEFDGVAGTVTCNCGGIGSNVVGMPYDRWVEVRQVIDLDNDYAEIFFDGTLFASYIWTSGYSGSTGHAVGSIKAIDLYATGMGAGMYVDDMSLEPLAASIGTSYCGPAVPNSTGASGAMAVVGFTSVATNDVTLSASSLPNNAFGFFLTSRTQGFVTNPGGSQGNLCLGGSIGRYVGPGQIKNTGSTGGFSLQIDLTQMPQPTGIVTAAAGETWNFQSWFRDSVGGSATSNFTDGASVTWN